MTSPDVVVVGAGPAGLSAAVEAAAHGLKVILIDGAGQPGGQFWRHPDPALDSSKDGHGHHDWKIFLGLLDRLAAHQLSGLIDYRPNTVVWLMSKLENGRTRIMTQPSEAVAPAAPTQLETPAVILCTGGYDRQIPIPGWDLPGVMAAGGVQALLKGHGVLAGRRVAVGGAGPFLLPVATGLADAGAKVVGVFEANSPTRWLRHPIAAAGVPAKAIEGASYTARMVRHRIGFKVRTVISAIEGADRVEAVRVEKIDAAGNLVGKSRRIEVDLVALGWGFTPSMELPLMLNLPTRVDLDQSLVTVVDDRQLAAEGVYVAGEATGVGGAALSCAEGTLAGLACAVDQGRAADSRAEAKLRVKIKRGRSFARAMHLAHPIPSQWPTWLRGDTIVCRCEEVPLAHLQGAHRDLGAEDARTMKSLTRTGMGWCQGRVCGFASGQLCASLAGSAQPAADAVQTARRPFAAPVRIEDLASLRQSGSDGAALNVEM